MQSSEHLPSLLPIHRSNKVLIELFGEGMCPYTALFSTGTLHPLMQLPGMDSLVEVDYTPFGNAYYLSGRCGGVRAPTGCDGSTSCLYNSTTRECWDESCGREHARVPAWCLDTEPNCQHGEVECVANQVQACAKELGCDPTAVFSLAVCMFDWYLRPQGHMMWPGNATASSVLYVAHECARTTNVPWARIDSCLQSPERRRAATRAAARNTPVHDGVPWVMVDGKPLDYDDEPTIADLAATVCAAASLTASDTPACLPRALAALRRQQQAKTEPSFKRTL